MHTVSKQPRAWTSVIKPWFELEKREDGVPQERYDEERGEAAQPWRKERRVDEAKIAEKDKEGNQEEDDDVDAPKAGSVLVRHKAKYSDASFELLVYCTRASSVWWGHRKGKGREEWDRQGHPSHEGSRCGSDHSCTP